MLIYNFIKYIGITHMYVYLIDYRHTCDCIRFHKCKLSTFVLENLSRNSTNESSIKISTDVGRLSRIANDQPHMKN